MAGFMIRFLFCNIFICGMTGILLAAKRLLKNSLTSRMQYNLWFVFLGILAVPFIPVRPLSFWQMFSWLGAFQKMPTAHADSIAASTAALSQSGSADWMNDFTISASQEVPSGVGLILCAVWMAGIFAMTMFLVRAKIRLNSVKKSALPLQNREVRRLYHDCLDEMKITKNIPVYSTAFLKSPIIVGLFRPCIYLPIHLISDCQATEIRYMLLHELQHYKHKDALANYLMNFASVIYWFNPLIWYALKEMRNDREVACDTSVLKMLHADAYGDYGNTLLNFAGKISLMPFPFASGISGSMAQMKKRIVNIANYHPVTFGKSLRGILAFCLTIVFLSGFVPVLSTQAANQDYYFFPVKDKNISYLDLSADFNGYDGSFVLYDTTADSWQIYHMDSASTRISPASTYKIYIALSGLDSGVITPEQSQLPWNGQKYAFDTWNADQTLDSAMQNSVNWYFQAIDRQIGLPSIRDFVQEIGYGNQRVSGDTDSYWANASLKISPIEQVEMLKKLYYNELPFSREAVETVKDSLCLFSTADCSFYGKTGTEAVNGQNTCGWFIGFLEKDGHTYFFATNIQGESDAGGAAAAELTFSILSEQGISPYSV